MALGGGTYTAMDKKLPGTYINVISKNHAVDDGERGVVAMGLAMDWGPDSEVFEVKASEIRANAKKLFGYNLDADEMINIREIFRHATKLIAYRLTSGGTKASNDVAEAKYPGIRGNDLKVTIAANVDDDSKYDVITIDAGTVVDTQTVSSVDQLVANDYVTFKSKALTAGTTALTGGANGSVTGDAHQAALNAFENYEFNILGLDATDETTKKLYTAYTKRMRDQRGIKFQTVLHNYAADYEGVLNVKNTVSDEGVSAAALVYWVAGAEAGCNLPAAITNATYDGEYDINVSFTQAQIEASISAGELMLHRVGGEIHVLVDINSLTTFSTAKGEIFCKNATIRVVDTIAAKTSALFAARYIGNVINNQDGRMSLWSDLAIIHRELETVGAISGFDTSDLEVTAGEAAGDVVIRDAITIAGTMEKLYMTVLVD
ncbi:MAG: phage tail sheath family protein [Eubacteriales bacterium]|jgi:hypothetical protein|nr:phage tail sheath family protein [Eubacteriales bacterium]